MTVEEFKKKAKKMSDEPGVYFFLGPKKEVLYIGKATSLRDRVRSYFAGDLMETRGPVIVGMVERAKYLDWRVTDSVLEALILEANLIRTHKPPANSIQKDDKSFNYVVFTNEDFPVIMLKRSKELAAESSALAKMVGLHGTTPRSLDEPLPRGSSAPSSSKSGYLYVFGPFPHGLQLKEAMHIIRKIFPYRDAKCIPAAEMLAKGKKPKACFNRHIGLCPGVCTGEVSKTEYRKMLRRIVLLFQGKKGELIRSLERDMKVAAKEERFEEAATLKRQLFALQHIQDVSLIKEEYRRPHQRGETRIEAYDVAHLGGFAAVGVMTVVEDGIAAKGEYRKFRLRVAKPGDDPGSLREILSRRLAHQEWPMPRIIAVDGAAAQINAAERLLKELGLGIPVVGVVKDEKHRPREIRGDRAIISGRERDILLANAEAHRFAITYHRKRSRSDLTS